MESFNKHSILVDVTSFISAQEYILSRFLNRPAFDPYALQSYAELIQTLLIYDKVYVSHPTKVSNCTESDFGDEPQLLKILLNRGLVTPLSMESNVLHDIRDDENDVHKWLRVHGADKIQEYIDITEQDEKLRKKQKSNFDGNTISRLSKWCEFHRSSIRYDDSHHKSRICTEDGIEEDAFGEYARHCFTDVYREKYNEIFKGQLDYLIATIMRSLKYQTRAKICDMVYQPHVLRRDFVLGYNVASSDLPEDYARELIKLIHGIHDEMKKYSDPNYSKRIKLLKFNIPLLGGKLWTNKDKLRYKDSCLEYVVDRIESYYSHCSVLRNLLKEIYHEEDLYKLEADFEATQFQVLEACGLINSKLSEVDNMLLKVLLAVLGTVPGVPNMKGVLVNAASLSKKMFYRKSNPAQQFVYREFLKGWKALKK